MEKSTLIAVGIFVLVVIAGWAFVSFRASPSEGTATTTGAGAGNAGVTDIALDAQRFEFSRPVIEVKQGERVRIRINNLDTLHGMRIPDLGVQGNDVVEFVASQKGEFPFYCNNYCGEGHSQMTGKIVVR